MLSVSIEEDEHGRLLNNLGKGCNRLNPLKNKKARPFVLHHSRLEDTSTEKLELAITNTVLVLPWKYETRPYLHLYTLSAAPSFVQAQKRERERRKQRNVMDYDQISVSLCSAHDHADVKLSNKVLLLQGSSRLTPSMAALSLRPNP
ncbi:hypothetical protein F2Q68_00015587 [Brassica cretica]|uniref:Uncharacterized protein n=1 Tax=Brassica cretica TaxID=69181 RepID=A0A8S9HLY5_BRACR|nr:hypothetical protein F2Q68_00015587 [Brassica cretica]